MTAHGAQARARTSEIAPQQRKIGEQPHVLRAAPVLGQAHAIDENRLIGFDIGACGALQIAAAQAGSALDQTPVSGAQVVAQALKADRMTGNEVDVEHARLISSDRRIIHLDAGLHRVP